MSKNQELQVILWRAINGVILPMNVIKKHGVQGEAERIFLKIYSDPKLSVLLVLQLKTSAECCDFWNENLQDRKLDSEIMQFLISDECAKIIDVWQSQMLENVIRTSSCEELKAVCRALWHGVDEGQIRLYIGNLIMHLEKNVPVDVVLQTFHVLAMFTDKIAIMDEPKVIALLGKYGSMLNLNLKS